MDEELALRYRKEKEEYLDDLPIRQLQKLYWFYFFGCIRLRMDRRMVWNKFEKFRLNIFVNPFNPINIPFMVFIFCKIEIKSFFSSEMLNLFSLENHFTSPKESRITIEEISRAIKRKEDEKI